MDLLVSLLYLLLTIAVIVLVAALLVWGLRQMGIAIDPQIFRIGQLILALVILIAIVTWIAGVAGYGSPFFYRPRP